MFPFRESCCCPAAFLKRLCVYGNDSFTEIFSSAQPRGWFYHTAKLRKETWSQINFRSDLESIQYMYMYIITFIYMSNGLNLLHPRKDVAEMVIVSCVSLIVPEDLMFAIKSGEHVYQESSFFVSPLSFLKVSWWYQVSMSWCNCSKMSEVLAGAHI